MANRNRIDLTTGEVTVEPLSAEDQAALDQQMAEQAVAAVADEAEATNKATIEQKLDAALVSLRAIKAETNSAINTNAAQRIKDLVDVLLPVVRHIRRNFDGTA